MSISATTRGLRPGVCTSTTRPASPFDGMMIYETDTNLVRIWNGSAWKTLSYSDPTNGTVLQIVSTTKTDTYSLTSTTDTDVTGLTASITPTSTSSKVFVMVSLIAMQGTGTAMAKLVRGSTDICIGDAASNRIRASAASYKTGINTNLSFQFLDSPATTSSTTYKIQVKGQNSSAAAINILVGATGDDADRGDNARYPSTITLMEIAG